MPMPLRALAPLTLLLALPACICDQHRSERTEEFQLSATDAARLVGETHNGSIRIVAGPAGELRGRARIVGWANSPHAAELVRDRIALTTAQRGDCVEVGWDWTEDPGMCESGSVDFELVAPPDWHVALTSHNGDLALDGVAHAGAALETHNGEVEVHRTPGALRVVTHNGEIEVTDAAGELDLESHNGDVAVNGPFVSLKAVTHNGNIAIDAAGDATLPGTVESHNGEIHVALGGRRSRVEFATHHGELELDLGADAQVRKLDDESAVVEVGGADQPVLRVRTWNGDVRLSTRRSDLR